MEKSFSLQQVLLRYPECNSVDFICTPENLEQKGVNAEFVFALQELFEEEKNFREEQFLNFPIEDILDYIVRTHKYYLEKKIQEIEQSIHLLLQDYSDNHPLLIILNSFFSTYKKSLIDHINVEEEILIPYIQYLIQADKIGIELNSFMLKIQDDVLINFIHEHDDTEQDLKDACNAILQYQPPLTNESPYRILLNQLGDFEKDLAVHALIEDGILLPRAQEMEQYLIEEFNAKVLLN
ncbi:hypothetical protein BH11BAC2_BH11BAC2_12000 [soil metagenome]